MLIFRFSAFQVVGAWANTGMSLVDQNMVPFRTAYPMIIFLVICVLAGNTALVSGPLAILFMHSYANLLADLVSDSS